MSKVDDGGAAFPGSVSVSQAGDVIYGFYGMSLRDYFAAQCISEMIRLSQDADGEWSASNVANGCYHVADAMLAARKREG